MAHAHPRTASIYVLSPASICLVPVSSLARRQAANKSTHRSTDKSSTEEPRQKTKSRDGRAGCACMTISAQSDAPATVCADKCPCELWRRALPVDTEALLLPVRMPVHAFVVARARVARALVASIAMEAAAAEQRDGVAPLDILYALVQRFPTWGRGRQRSQ